MEKTMLKIKDKLDEEGFNKDDLAGLLNVSPSTINRWYRLERFPNPKAFRLLTNILYDDVTEFDLYKTADTNERLFLLRMFSGLSFKELSESVIISRILLSNWEKGDTSPTFTQTQRLAMFYDVPQEDLGVPVKQTTVGSKIRQERLALGITQSALANELGVSPSSMSLYERDVSEIPKEVLVKITDVLETSEDYLAS